MGVVPHAAPLATLKLALLFVYGFAVTRTPLVTKTNYPIDPIYVRVRVRYYLNANNSYSY